MNALTSLSTAPGADRTPSSLPASTYEMIGETARSHPNAKALSFFLRVQDHERPCTWDYATLFAKITATANLFHQLGIHKNDVVAFVLPNLPETHFAIWGAQAAGIAFAINPLLEPASMAELLRAGDAKVLVTLAPQEGADLWSKLGSVIDEVPTLQHLVLVGLNHYRADPAPLDVDHAADTARVDTLRITVHDFNEGIKEQCQTHLVSGRQIQPEDLSSFFCTGGTTGAPKIAMRTHRNEVANAWSAGQMLAEGIEVGKTLFCGLPLFHVNAVLVTGLLPFSRGAHVILGTPGGYRGEGVIQHFWDLVERHRINFFSGVPTIYAALMQFPWQGHDLSSLEYGLCGAAPMPAALMRNFEESTGLKILEGYGLTEGTCVSTVNPPHGERRTASIGLSLPQQAMKAVVLDEQGAYVRDCEADEVGLLVIRGPNVFKGYKMAEHNVGLWLEAGDGEPWLNTGDLGRQDQDGYFYLTGRKKELIIRGGHNIDPASIEEPLHRHPAVQLAAAVGRPDRHSGELPIAYVQLKPGASATEEDLIAYANAHIGERAAVPKSIRLVTSMPLTGVGKIFKPELRLREVSDVTRTALSEAGVLVSKMDVFNDPKVGTMVVVVLVESTAANTAKEVLGRFPFRFELSWES